MKKILLVGKVVEETKDMYLVTFEASPGWKWVSKKAISRQSKTRRKKA